MFRCRHMNLGRLAHGSCQLTDVIPNVEPAACSYVHHGTNDSLVELVPSESRKLSSGRVTDSSGPVVVVYTELHLDMPSRCRMDLTNFSRLSLSLSLARSRVILHP